MRIDDAREIDIAEDFHVPRFAPRLRVTFRERAGRDVARADVPNELARLGVDVRTGCNVTNIDADGVDYANRQQAAALLFDRAARAFVQHQVSARLRREADPALT